jgi:pyruvate,orthophosphate dikinase
VLDADTAEEPRQGGRGRDLVRWETTPDDIHGLIHAAGVLTAHGGMTSHAAVVARGMGKPCVAGCEDLSIDVAAGTLRIGTHDLRAGDVITIDGGSGRVILGSVPLVPPALDENFATILDWADGLRRLRVRANADTPEDAAKAREFGAEGIGLCRTEHMFMGEERLPVVREMILARDEEERRASLERLLPMQQGDFEGIFEAMAGLPVTIRPPRPAAPRVPAIARGGDLRRDARPIRQLHEANPMLGTRGCRLGLQFPEIYEMQVRAIVRAARPCRAHGRGAARRDHAPARRLHRGARAPPRADRARRRRGADGRVPVRTMIELPRAAPARDEIAAHADFFSFGTNDLTQTTLGFSRDDAEGKFLTYYLEHGILSGTRSR